jgi:tetratricopeptide (TPR) repeat protein
MKIFGFRLVLITGIIAFGIAATTSKIQSQELSSAQKLSLSERYEDADSLYQQIIKSSPGNSEAYFYYGENILRAYIADPYSNSLTDVSQDAIEQFKKGIAADTGNALNNVGIGMVILLEKNDTSAADVYFRKAELTFPKKIKKYTAQNVTTLIKLGQAQLYARNPRYGKAIGYLERAKAIAPENTDVWLASGEILESQGNASAAVTNYNKAVYINSKIAIPYVKVGNLYMRSRNLEDARANFEKAQQIDSLYAPLYRSLGEMYSLAGLDNLSVINYRKFLALSGNNIPAKIQYLISLFRAKKYTEALSLIEEILNYDKSRNYLYRMAAYSSYEKKPADYQKAQMYMETFLKKATPDKIIVKDYAYYGRTLLKLKDTSVVDKAFTQLLTAYKMDTTDMDLVSDIAINAYIYKKYDLSIDMLNKKIAFGKADNKDFMNLGKAYYQSKQYGKADTVFSKILSMDPANMPALTWKASTYVAIDPTSTDGLARPVYETIIQKGLSDTVKYIRELFDSYSYMGSYFLYTKSELNKAEGFFQKITWLDPKNNAWLMKGYTSLGSICQKRKEYVKAINYYKLVLKIDPKYKAAQNAIDQCQRELDLLEVKRQLGE